MPYNLTSNNRTMYGPTINGIAILNKLNIALKIVFFISDFCFIMPLFVDMSLVYHIK